MEISLSSKIIDANKSLIEKGDLDSIREFFTNDYVVHITGRDIKGGHKIVLDILDSLRKSFPDIEVEVEVLLEGRDRISWQRTLKGTHKGNFKGFPASNLHITWRDMVTSQFSDGLISEEWVITDLAEQLLLSRKKKS